MTSGSHSISIGLTLANGAIYMVSFDGADGSGNAAATVTSTNILYDATAASVTLNSPAASSAVNNATTGYTLSKDVASGRIVYSRTSGATDGASPHIHDLSGTELAAGPHTAATGITLADGAVYTVDIENVVDLEGNTSAVVSNTGIRYDLTAVAITNTSPLASSATSTTAVGYTLSEQATTGKVTFTRTGGAADGNSPQVYTLSGSELIIGPHTVNTDLGLVDGTIYTVSFDATDQAGNNATAVSNALVTFDQTAPVDGTLDAAPGNTQNVVTWSGFTDAASGVSSYSLVSSPTATPSDCSGTAALYRQRHDLHPYGIDERHDVLLPGLRRRPGREHLSRRHCQRPAEDRLLQHHHKPGPERQHLLQPGRSELRRELNVHHKSERRVPGGRCVSRPDRRQFELRRRDHHLHDQQYHGQHDRQRNLRALNGRCASDRAFHLEDGCQRRTTTCCMTHQPARARPEPPAPTPGAPVRPA